MSSKLVKGMDTASALGQVSAITTIFFKPTAVHFPWGWPSQSPPALQTPTATDLTIHYSQTHTKIHTMNNLPDSTELTVWSSVSGCAISIFKTQLFTAPPKKPQKKKRPGQKKPGVMSWRQFLERGQLQRSRAHRHQSVWSNFWWINAWRTPSKKRPRTCLSGTVSREVRAPFSGANRSNVIIVTRGG